MPVRPAIIPGLVYDDAPAAIGFLVRAFGFTEHLVVPGSGGTVAHAQLALDGNLLMLSSITPDKRARYEMNSPAALGATTACMNVVLDDPDAHHARAAAAGAEIVAAPHANDYGGRGYEARDPEGHLWCFMSYDPYSPAL